MSLLGSIINLSLLAVLAMLTRVLPRRFGLPGMFIAHLLMAVGFGLMGMIATITGVWAEYDGVVTILGLLFQAFLVNCLLLPIAFWAMRRRRHELRLMSRH